MRAAMLFRRSGIDKIVDRGGNLEWLKGHFAKSPLAGVVPVLLAAITIFEVAAGGLSAIFFNRDRCVFRNYKLNLVLKASLCLIGLWAITHERLFNVPLDVPQARIKCLS